MIDYPTCKLINGGLCFVGDRVMFCCRGNTAQSKATHRLIEHFDGGKIDWDAIFEERAKAIDLLKNGSCPDYCQGCIDIRKHDLLKERERCFDYILFSTWEACNCACLYCNCNIKPGKYLIKDLKKYEKEHQDTTFNIIPTVYDMIQNKYIRDFTTIDFAGGEPTIYPYFDTLVQMLLDAGVKKMIIHTNAIKFSKVVEKAIKSGVMDIVVSIDSGTKEGYEKIKRVAAYKQVWKNLKKYAKAKWPSNSNEICLKYVIMPGINDSKEELIQWVQQGVKAGVNLFILNGDDNFFFKPKSEHNPEVLKRIVDLSSFFSEYMLEHCYQFVLYTNCIMAYEELGIREYCGFNLPRH